MPKEEINFYHDQDPVDSDFALTPQEEKDRADDWEDIENQRTYQAAQKDKWNYAGAVYNILQSGNTDDRIANIALGYSRMMIDTGIAQMTEGEPEFDFDPIGPSDSKKTILWRDMVKMIMSNSNYRSHQQIFFTDMFVFGTGVFEVYTQLPFRTIRTETDNGFNEEVVRDFSKPRIGVRAISPFRCTRNPNITDPNDVPSCSKVEILSWDQFVQMYGRAKTMKGDAKYKNIKLVGKGSHVEVVSYYNEIRDVYRIYATPFGTESDGYADTPPNEIGIPIFDKPLKIKETLDKKGNVVRSEGLNLQGKCPLVFATYNDKLDVNFESHSVYGMGLPEHMEGIDTLVQTFFNMNIDNWRMSNTVLLSYEGDGRSVPDFDATEYYGSELFEGALTPVPLGQSSTNDFSAIMEILNNFSIPMTGINFSQIVGDTSKTAFEFSQRIRANNRRAEHKLKTLEDGPFKRLGLLLLSGGLSELTVEEYQELTEQQTKIARQRVTDREETPEDFIGLSGDNAKRKVRDFIPVQGMKESFEESKTRVFDINSTSNTLIEDKDEPERINKIPASRVYLYPASYIERGMLPDVIVDGKRMLNDMKAQDAQTFTSVQNMAFQLAQFDPKFAQSLSAEKMFGEVLEFAQMNPDDVMKDVGEGENAKTNQLLSELKQAISPDPNAQPTQGLPAPAPNAGVSVPQPQGLNPVENSLTQLSQGAL